MEKGRQWEREGESERERERERRKERTSRERYERTRRAPYRHPIPLGYCFLMWPGGLRRSTHRMVLFVVTKITGCGLQRGRGNVTYRVAERRTVDRYRRQSDSNERHEFCLPSFSHPFLSRLIILSSSTSLISYLSLSRS